MISILFAFIINTRPLGSISIDEFLSMPELAENPIASRVVSLFDTDNNGEVDFAEFIAGISVFSVKGVKEG